MRIGIKKAGLVGAPLMAWALLGVVTPAPLAAQDTTRAAEDSAPATEAASQQASSVDQAEMQHYVELQLEIDRLQEDAIQEMVRIHSVDGRAQIRNNLTEGIASAHEAHEMTAERYKTITFLISSDTAVRELFETTMAAAQEGGDGGG